MKKSYKIALSCLLGLSLLAGCGSDQIISKQLKEICAAVPQTTLTKNCNVSRVEIQSVKDYYKNLNQEWNTILSNDPPGFYKDGIIANKEIAAYLKRRQDTEEFQVFVISEEPKRAHGFYLYFFAGYDGDLSDELIITTELVQQANNFIKTSKTGEYYYIGEKAIITVAYDIVEDDISLLEAIGNEANK